MVKINPHIHFNGNTEEAFEFYRSVLGGELNRIIRYKDLSNQEFTFPEEELNKIIHIALPIGSSTVLTGSDVPNILGKVSESENRSKILLNAGSKEEAEKIFNGLSQGGSIEAPLSDGPWGTHLGMFRDKYGIEWMVEYASAQ